MAPIAPVLDVGLPPAQRFAAIAACYVVLAMYLRGVVSRAAPGMARLVLAAPILAANVVSPWLFDVHGEILARTSCLFILFWLCSFKVINFCLGRGPLEPGMTTPQMCCIMTLPIFPKPVDRSKGALEGRLQDTAGSSSELIMRWLGKLVILGGIVACLVVFEVPRPLKDMLYSFGMWAFIGFLMDGPAGVFMHALGLEIVPTFDQPWLSSSLADFWGRRWNVTTSSVLRTTVYDPIVERSLVRPSARPPRPGMTLRTVGVAATFLVSGLIHEYMLWNLSPTGQLGWKWLTFFTIQAPLLMGEQVLGRYASKAGLPPLPLVLRILLTLALLEAGGYYLFFAAVEADTDVAARVVSACKSNYLSVFALVAGAGSSILPGGGGGGGEL